MKRKMYENSYITTAEPSWFSPPESELILPLEEGLEALATSVQWTALETAAASSGSSDFLLAGCLVLSVDIEIVLYLFKKY